MSKTWRWVRGTCFIQRLDSEIGKILALPATAEKFKADGAIPEGGTAQDFGERIKREIDIRRKTVSPPGIKVVWNGACGMYLLMD